MSRWLKALVALALVVPIAAYVAGSLVSSNAREPADRGPVIINDATSPAAPRTSRPTTSARPSPTGSNDPVSPAAPPVSSAPPTVTATVPPATRPAPSSTVRDDDSREPEEPADDDTARVVTPHPTPVDDGDDDGVDDDAGSGDDADDGDD